MQMDRRAVLAGGLATSALATTSAEAQTRATETPLPDGATDRADALALLRRMAEPVLGRMARGRLRAEWTPELSPTWDGRNPGVAYLEAFGRLIDGIAPWLALPDDAGEEGRLRARLRTQALESYTHAVDPKSPDYLLWRGHGQALVDSAYFTSALLRAPTRSGSRSMPRRKRGSSKRSRASAASPRRTRTGCCSRR